jgi:hypothetical protein
MTDLSLITTAATLFGAFAVIVVSALDFHTPYKVSDIRYAVLGERYYLAIVAYSMVAVIFYLMALHYVLILVTYFTPVQDSFTPAQASAVRLTLAIPATIAVMVLVPHVPALRGGVDALRGMMQTLARYPQTAETLTAIISRASFTINARATSEVARELEGYGVSKQFIEGALAGDNKVLAVGAATMIQQVCSLHLSFNDLSNDPQFKKFFSARKAVFSNLEKQYRRVLRRSARALFLAEDIPPSDQESGELALQISDFIAQECEDLRGEYQRLLAEVSVSSVLGQPARAELISSFGYQVALPHTLPFLPLVAIFVLDFIFSAAPVFFLLNMPNEFKVTPQTAGLTSLAHACGLTISVFFAIYPKTSTNFARPSLTALPWLSYILFGLVSFLIGTAILYLTYTTVELGPGWPARSHPLTMSFLISAHFLLSTVVLSILLDVRLRNTLLDYFHWRFRDGMTFAVVMMCAAVSVVVGFLTLSSLYGLALPNIHWGTYALYVILLGVLGFVMGYLLPSTAEAYIEANKIILRSVEKEGMLLSWATQQYRPRRPLRS